MAAEVLQLGCWLFARLVTLDHPERVSAADAMTTVLGIGLVLLPVGFVACFRRSPTALRIALSCATASLVLAVVVAAIGAAGMGASDPVVSFFVTLVILAAPGLILLACALAIGRSKAAYAPS